MARGAVRKKRDICGGVVLQGSRDVFVNGKGASRKGDRIGDHGYSPHSAPRILKGSSNVFINNRKAARRRDPGSCGHRCTGSRNVFIN